ncbi:MAG TPA: ABC transporter permease [Bryobacterales bacterium]|nr:ABC transporter permease [Bryobacterales bacterium]
MRRLLESRLWALTVKEFRLLGKNRRLVVQLTLPPTVFVVLIGFALNPDVHDLRLGVTDLSRTPASRELISAISENRTFRVAGYYASAAALGDEIGRRRLDAGVVIPPDYDRLRANQLAAPVQVLVDAVNANTGTIASGYLAQIFADYNQRSLGAAPLSVPGVINVSSAVTVLYNPGLESSWFIVTGVMSMLLVINGSLVAAGLVVREKELGTIEQLLMTPAQTLEILLAKTFPILVLLVIDLAVSLAITHVVFDLPVRGSFGLLAVVGLLAGLGGVGIGVLMGTACDTQQQSQLLAFFINPPLVVISGAVTPVESMPRLLQWLSYADPLRYLAQALRGIVLKGAGLWELWMPLAALLAFSVLLYGWSALRFRRQLG